MAKNIYSAILPFKLPRISSQEKWNDIYPIQQEPHEDYWKEIYSSPYKATRESKLQAFQFRIIHRVIPCNRFLCNIRIKQEDHCSFCDPPVTDTLQHFFFSCPLAASFWASVRQWLETQVNVHIEMMEREYMFGVPKEVPQARMFNLLALTVKHFIYRQKLFHNAALDLTHFLRELRVKLGMEKLLCTQEKKPAKFRQWARIYSALG